MEMFSRGVLHRVAWLGILLGAVCSGIFGILLVANALREHGGTPGDILVGGGGILFLIISAVLFTTSASAWQSSKQMQ
jgi:hypothetical protein